MKDIARLISVFVFVGLGNFVFGQHDCPAFPKQGTFDSVTFIRTAIPTDPAKAEGIWLGQGEVLRNGTEIRRAYIPDNRPEHAIGVAVAWNYHRNLIHRVEVPHIGYWLATTIQEVAYTCDPGALYADPDQVEILYTSNYANWVSTAASNMNAFSKGCFQIEGPNGSAWFQLGQNYPTGRFPTSQHHPLAGTFTTAALVKSYYDVYTKEVYQNQKGWDVYESIDCTIDEYAYEKVSGSGYNGGINAFAGNATWFSGAHDGNANWSGLAATTAQYGNDVASWITVLENDPTDPNFPAGSSFGEYYNDDILWSDMLQYLSEIQVMYPEINFAT